MSAKCNYSIKFAPLLLQYKQTLSDAEFKNKCIELFNNGDAVYKKISTGAFLGTNAYLSDIQDARGDSLSHSIDEYPKHNSIKSLYTKDDISFNRLKSDFKKGIVSRTFYDPDYQDFDAVSYFKIGKWLDPTSIVGDSGIDVVNYNMFMWKVDLANSLLRALGGEAVELTPESENAIEKFNILINTAISMYEDAEAHNRPIYKKTKDNYVMLSRFNQLLDELTPFVKVKREYKYTTHHALNMYEYTGPNVKLRMSWSNNDNPVDAASQYSDLAQIILEILPEVNSSGEPISGTSIGVSGFMSAMTALKTAITYSRHALMQEAAQMDPQTQMYDIITRYMKFMSENQSGYELNHITYLVGKLHAIRDYIYGRSIGTNEETELIRNMFTNMFLNTEVLSYRTYGTYNGEFGGTDLKQRFQQEQEYDLQDRIRGRILEITRHPEEFSQVLKDYNVTWKDHVWTMEIGNTKFSFQVNDNFSTKVVNSELPFIGMEQFSELIYKLFDYVIPSDYEVVGAQIFGWATEDEKKGKKDTRRQFNMLNQWLPMIGMLFEAYDKDNGLVKRYTSSGVFDFFKSKAYEQLKNAARVLSVIKGSETRHTVRDVNDNNLPLFGMTSLAFNFREIVKQYRKTNDSVFDNTFLGETVLSSGTTANYSDKEPGQYGFIKRSIVGQPVIREGIKLEGSSKKSASMQFTELMEVSIIYDFLNPLINDPKDSRILLQSTTNADKSRQFLIPYDLSQPIRIPSYFVYDSVKKSYINPQVDLRSILIGISKGDKASEDIMREIIHRHRGSRYNKVAEKVLNDYEKVFGKHFDSLEALDDELKAKQLTLSELRKMFRDAGVDFVNETHATVLGGVTRVNETFKNYVKIFNDPELLAKRIERCKRRMVYDLLSEGFLLNRFVSRAGSTLYKILNNESTNEWIDTKSGDIILGKIEKDGIWQPIGLLDLDILMDKNVKFKINPALASYLYADSFLSTEYNELTLNFVWAHPYKPRDLKNVSHEPNGYDMSIYDEAAEAARLIVQNKRSVTPGASIHKFTPNYITRQVHHTNKTVAKRVNTGIAGRIKVAAMEDIETSFDFLTGSKEGHGFKSMDGSGLSNPFMAIMENNSLHDSATGYDKKTIMQSNDGVYGSPVLLKWAVYALTNSRRRLGRKSSVSVEDLVRKMNSILFDETPDINLRDYFDQYFPEGFYIENPETQTTSKVNVQSVTLQDGKTYYVRTFRDLDASGNLGEEYYVDKHGYRITGELLPEYFELENIYDIDQFFGGAYMKEMIDGKLQYSDKGTYAVTDIIINHDLKDYMIAYVVNESAMKVGVTNSNPVDKVNKHDAWHNPSYALDYFEMSTENGGLQMNAEHELDEAEVTEMTQMISALIENGYSSNIVNLIYEDIGRVVVDSLKKYIGAINKTNDSRIYQLVGQALIDAYKTGSKDTLGLAQVFFALAESNIRTINPEFKIPFSAETIYPTFVSTVSSALNKKGIRRKYDGIAAVLTPAHDMIQLYTFEGKTLTYNELARELVNWKRRPENAEYANWTIDEFIGLFEKPIVLENGTYTTQINPFYQQLTPENINELEFDTIVYLKNGILDEKTGIVRHEINIEDYATRKQILDIVRSGSDQVYISLKGRNLRGGNTYFTRIINGQEVKFSAYDLMTVGALIELKNNSKNKAKLEVFKALNNSYAKQYIIAKEGITSEKVSEALNSGNIVELSKVIDVEKSLKNVLQHQLKDAKSGTLTDYIFFDLAEDGSVINETPVIVSNVTVTPAECVMGRMHAKKFGIRIDDNLNDILQGKEQWFYDRLRTEYQEQVNVKDEDKSLYDVVVYTKSGKAVLVKFSDFGDTRAITSKPNVTISKNIDIIDGDIYYQGQPIAEEGQAVFYTYRNGDDEYELMCVDSPEALKQIMDLDTFGFYTFNSESKAVDKVLSIFATINNETYYVDEGNGTEPIFTGTIEDLMNSDNTKENKAKILAAIESQDFEWRLRKLAQDRWQSFNLSLNLIGTRIPTQAMQSFMPMRVVAFSDSEVNEIYVSRTMPILQGSDYK